MQRALSEQILKNELPQVGLTARIRLSSGKHLSCGLCTSCSCFSPCHAPGSKEHSRTSRKIGAARSWRLVASWKISAAVRQHAKPAVFAARDHPCCYHMDISSLVKRVMEKRCTGICRSHECDMKASSDGTGTGRSLKQDSLKEF